MHKLRNEKLHVIAVLSNPIRYDSRYKLFEQFKKYIAKFPNAVLHTVEIAFGDRQHYVTGAEDFDHIQVRSFEELWHKENMINIGLQHLPEDWEYVAWIDADIVFSREDWVEETIHQLQHYMVVQMFETAVDLGPQQQAMKVHKGFMSQYLKGELNSSSSYYRSGHPGFAWADRREAIDALGGVIDFGILGSGDRHMACGLIGKIELSYSGGLHPEYGKWLKQWQNLAERHVKRDVGFVTGSILHSWHGKKVDRQYASRWQILVKHQFNPATDLKRDSQGLWQLEVWDSRQRNLRDAIRAYFRARREDSTDME